MKKTVVCSLIAASLLVSGSMAMAKTNKNIVARKAAAAVTIDGDLKEFLTPAPAGEEIGIISKTAGTLEQGEIDDDKDFSVKYYALYDASNIYLGFDVTDDVIQGPATGGDIWKNDTIEVWFDADNDDTETEMAQDDEHQIGLTIATNDEPGAVGHMVWRSVLPDDLMNNLKYAGKVKKDGWTIEAKIPISALHGSFSTVKAGQKLGFNVSMVDNDEGDWNHLTWAGTLHSDPSQFGQLVIK